MSSDCFSNTRYRGWSIEETLNSIIFLGRLVISTLAFTSITGDPLELGQTRSHFFASVESVEIYSSFLEVGSLTPQHSRMDMLAQTPISVPWS